MTKNYVINRDVYNAITLPNMNEFRVTDIRNLMQRSSDLYDNDSNASQLVMRQFEKLEKTGLLTSKGTRQSKLYSKTAAFHQAKFELKEKRLGYAPSHTTKKVGTVTSKQLLIEKSDIEAELTITLKEIDYYKVLMKRSKDLNKLLSIPLSEANKKSATLVAKLNTWTEAIRQLKQSESIKC